MSHLTAEKIIVAFKKLGAFLEQPSEEFKSLMLAAANFNAWFTPTEVQRSVASFRYMLQDDSIDQWFKTISVSSQPKKVGLILAGNIPMVGFHDILCVLATGNIAMVKLSSSDDKLLPALLNELVKIEPLFVDRILYVERLKDFEAVIATGSNNTSRYFEYYFGKVPHIIRKNRNSVAVITGDETPAEIEQLGHDIFDYFGLGCRNVSKVYLPEDYDVKYLFEPLETFQAYFDHFKYNNNYDYNKSIFLVNAAPHFDNGFLLLKEDSSFSSALAVLHFERYKNLEDVATSINAQETQIQCVVSERELPVKMGVSGFGQSQYPQLWDYADHVDTVAFLKTLDASK